MRVCKIFEFDAAHHIPNHPGKCANVHGHRWQVLIEAKGDIGPDGMVIDFGDMKEIVNPLIDRLDHHDLNDILPVPTAEKIAEWFSVKLRPQMPVSLIRVYETPTSYAEWRREEDGL